MWQHCRVTMCCYGTTLQHHFVDLKAVGFGCVMLASDAHLHALIDVECIRNQPWWQVMPDGCTGIMPVKSGLSIDQPISQVFVTNLQNLTGAILATYMMLHPMPWQHQFVAITCALFFRLCLHGKNAWLGFWSSFRHQLCWMANCMEWRWDEQHSCWSCGLTMSSKQTCSMCQNMCSLWLCHIYLSLGGGSNSDYNLYWFCMSADQLVLITWTSESISHCSFLRSVAIQLLNSVDVL